MSELLRPKWLWRWLLAGLAVASISVFYIASAQPDGLAHIYFLDVGQGDSIFIKTADNHRILVDGGPDVSVVNKLDHLLPVWDRRLDLVVLTHPHADHAAGLIEVFECYRVDEFLYNGATYESETYNTLLSLVKNKDIPIQISDAGDYYTFASSQLDIIHPVDEYQEFDDPNDSSIVASFRYRDFSVLLTGDIGVGVEADLSNSGSLSDVDVVKVAHQGSRTSTSQSFLDAVDPEVGVISVGYNSFGHPHQEVLSRLQASNVELYRTDENGTVEIVTDGIRYDISLLD